jgi:ribosomal-protein-alanine N-acetyltransferase
MMGDEWLIRVAKSGAINEPYSSFNIHNSSLKNALSSQATRMSHSSLIIYNSSLFPEIKTPRLLLRQVAETDAAALFSLRSDERVMRYFDAPMMQSEEEARAFLGKNKVSFEEGTGILWAISLLEDTTMIGTITIWRIDKTHFRGEMGYLLHPDFQGKGLMSEAIQAVLRYGFDTLNLHSMEANVNPNNQASITLLERNGFVREGYFRENYYFNGKFLDTAVYSRLSTNEITEI